MTAKKLGKVAQTKTTDTALYEGGKFALEIRTTGGLSIGSELVNKGRQKSSKTVGGMIGLNAKLGGYFLNCIRAKNLIDMLSSDGRVGAVADPLIGLCAQSIGGKFLDNAIHTAMLCDEIAEDGE